jgi:hypothetical protein
MLLKFQRAIADRVPGNAAMRPGTFRPSEASNREFACPAVTEDGMNDVNAPYGRTESEDPKVLNTKQARQGVTGHNVRYVLASGLVGVVIVFALAYLSIH